MRDILACSTDVNVWGPGIRYAAELSAKLGASLTGIHIAAQIPRRAPPGTPPSVLAEFVAYAQEEVQAAMQSGPRFAAWARQLGVRSTHWQVALGDPLDVLGAAGNWHDAIVIERRLETREDTTELIGEMLLSGFTCIAVPETMYAIGRLERIAIAFDGSPACIRALHSAIPLLSRAAHVILLTGKWRDLTDEPPVCRPAFDPVRHLAQHGIAVQSEALDMTGTDAGDVLLEAASRQRVDLLVTGVEGKRRLGETYLDPLPRHLLRYAGLPLCMAQ